MKAAFLRARAELRARLRSWVALTVLIGLGAGAVVAAVAAGRRTDTAYPRFVADHRAGNIVVYPAYTPEFAPVDYAAAARLHQVQQSARVLFVPLTEPDISFLAPGDGKYGRLVDQPKLVHGRMPRPSELGVAAVAFTIASRRHLGVGSHLTVHAIPGYQPNDSGPQLPPIALRLRVVGVEATPGEFPPLTGLYSENVHVSQAQARPGGRQPRR